VKELIIRWGVVLGIGVAAFLAGKEYSVQTAKPIIVTKIEQVQVEKLVTKTITIRDKHPDGSTTETITEDKVEDKASHSSSMAAVLPVNKKNNWGLGLDWGFDSYIPVGARIDRRILADGWVSLGANWNEPNLTLGIRWEF
jgi:hypothetical protein